MRAELAYFLIIATVLVFVTVVVMTTRYKRYERRLARGHRKIKPVWKPFWYK